MVAHVALRAVEVKIDMVSHIDRAGLINGGAVLNGDTIIVSQAIARGCLQMAGEALIAIDGVERKQHLAVVVADNLPATLVEAVRPAMELVAGLVRRG